MSELPRIGDAPPDIEARTYGGKTVSLSDFKGKKAVVLYFYPRDNTPGCTKEACQMRDSREALAAMGVEVLGVSTDSVRSHENFRDKHGLNFTLLSDEDGSIVRAYGVESERGSAKRVTFLIDKAGVVRHVWPKVRVRGHVEEVIAKIKELGIA